MVMVLACALLLARCGAGSGGCEVVQEQLLHHDMLRLLQPEMQPPWLAGHGSAGYDGCSHDGHGRLSRTNH
jgi:hypothetical protein